MEEDKIIQFLEESQKNNSKPKTVGFSGLFKKKQAEKPTPKSD